MTPNDRLHAQAVELAELIATRLTRLESEPEILAQVDQLWHLVAELAGRLDTEGKAKAAE